MTNREERCFKALIALYDASKDLPYYSYIIPRREITEKLAIADSVISCEDFLNAEQALEELYNVIPHQSEDADWWDDDLRKAMWKAKHILEFEPTHFIEQYRFINSTKTHFTKIGTCCLTDLCGKTVALFKIQYKNDKCNINS